MTRDEAIAYGKEQLEIFGGLHKEFIQMAIASLERPHGEWIQHVNEPSLWSCSICETVIYSEHEEDRLKFHKWCGCCGADMRGGNNDGR